VDGWVISLAISMALAFVCLAKSIEYGLRVMITGKVDDET
jgi:hypothetical protein